MMWSLTTIVATVRRFIRHFAVTFARGLAHVHRQIAGDRWGRGQDRADIPVKQSIKFRSSKQSDDVCFWQIVLQKSVEG
jgi:hypothetical protein